MAVVATCIGAHSPALAQWKRAETRGFVIYSDGDAAVLRENALQLELFESSLRYFHNLNPAERFPGKLHIYMVRRHDGLEAVRPGLHESVAGFYQRTNDGVYAMAIRERGDNSTLLHEYAHHFMTAAFNETYPSWFVEGFAEYFSTAQLTSRRVAIGDFNRGRAQWLEHGNWLPIAEIVDKRPWQLGDSNAVA
ncbi:hypothetical protein LTR94_030106, partial [Friedmanniomyces endolithicus]